ncbi:MAG: Hpt domain-containing protein [Pirellula sp.]|jgi:HPt (histidine-containing phosphotransfer) domain-containing protein|nr:Hpt domain-containing protein [Pirellula sp.]
MSTTNAEIHTIPPIFDREGFLLRCMGNQALAKKLAVVFAGTLPKEQRDLHSAIETNELDQVRRIAHRVRGTAKNICAVPLAEAAFLVEHAAEQRDVALLYTHLESLKKQVEAILDELASGA